MLDSRTTLILAALLFLVLPLLVVWTTAGHRDKAVLWWCSGSVVAGTGIVLMGVRPWVPLWLTFHVANTCLLFSMVLWAQSLRFSLGSAWRGPTVMASAVGAAAFYSTLYGLFEPEVRGYCMRLLLGGGALYTAWLAYRLARRLDSHNAAAISLCYLVLGLGLWAQVLASGGGGSVPSPFGNTWDASAIAAIALATSAVGHYCFTGMVLDRSARARLAALRARTAASEASQLDASLRMMDRQRRMVLVAGSLAHELNQPLTAALTHAQVAQRRLRAGHLDASALQDLLGRVQAGLARAGTVLERIRSSSEQRDLSPQMLDLRHVARSAADLMEAEWRRRGIDVRVLLAELPVPCHGDEVALSQVLVNLLRNATQAVERCVLPRIELQVGALGQEARVIIRDNGPGLADELQERWGEPFLGTRVEGLGLGLAISRSIIEQHGGRLELRNREKGGAEALLALPRREGAAA